MLKGAYIWTPIERDVDAAVIVVPTLKRPREEMKSRRSERDEAPCY